MDRNGIKQLAELLDASILSAPPSAKWLNISCPFAPFGFHKNKVDANPSFGVQVNKTGLSRMHCFACAKGAGELTELTFQLRGLGAELDWKALNELAHAEMEGAELPSLDDDEDSRDGLFVFPEEWLESFPLAVNSGHAMMYLANRKGGPIPTSVAAMLDLRWDPFQRRVCFPIRGQDGKLYGLHGRAVDAEAELPWFAYGYKKRRNPHVLLGEDRIDWNKPVLIAEAGFDLARATQVYRNVLSPLHGDLSPYQLERLTPLFEGVTLLDADKTGSIGRNKLTKWAGKGRILKHVYLKDGTDAGQTPIEELAAELSEHLDLDPLIA